MSTCIPDMAILVRHILKIVAIMLILIGMSLPTIAKPHNYDSNIEIDYQKTAELLAEYLDVEINIEDILEKCDCRVKIFNKNNELIRFGTANNEIMVNSISKSDFLLKINDIKYYRLD